MYNAIFYINYLIAVRNELESILKFTEVLKKYKELHVYTSNM